MSDQEVRVRFAPSPTGYLHVGGARTALFNWLFARRHGGKFVLRIEDTDRERNTQEALDAILTSMRWMGLDWDEGPESGGDRGPYFQSERQDIYAKYLAKLEEKGVVYDDDGALRLRSPKEKVTVDDRICGQTEVDRSQENDTALRRSDGSYIFHFVNVVDDIEMGITHVIRGADHLSNTAKHIEIFNALGVDLPVFAHIPLILNPDGSKMSKRDEGASMDEYRKSGFLPDAVRNYLCLLGWNPKDDREIMPIEEVLALFDWDHLNNSNARFDMEKCQWMNSQYVANLDEEKFVQLASAHLGDAHVAPDEDQLHAALRILKPKIKIFPEATAHLKQFFDGTTPVEPSVVEKVTKNADSKDHLLALADAFSEVTDWSGEAIDAAAVAAAEEVGAKKGKLMFPLRAAVLGSGQGADLVPAIELIGQAEVIERIRRRTLEMFG